MKILNTILKFTLALILITIPVTGQNYVNPQNLMELNSSSDDYAPVWNVFEQKLYFSSSRDGSSMFYTSVPIGASKFNECILLKGPLNNPDSHQSYITFVRADMALLAAYSLKKERSFINIFKTKFERNTWTKAFEDEILSVESFCGFPNVSPDGKLLVFSSDQNTQNKDLDLWFSYADSKEQWSKPAQLIELNTPGNEIAPCLLSSDTLVFASDGMEGPGKYDLYISVKRDGVWQTPTPLTGLNTQFNEIGFTRLPGGQYIFTSDRPGGKGELDLYICSKGNDNIVTKQENDELELNITTQTMVIRLIHENQTISVLPPQKNLDKTILDTNYIYDRYLYNNVSNNIHFSMLVADSLLIIKPKKLDLELDAGPAEMLASWSSYLVSTLQKKEIAIGNEMPFSKMIDLENLIDQKMTDDSLVIILNAKSKTGNLYEQRFLMNVNKSTSTGSKVYKDDDGSYSEILVPAFDEFSDVLLTILAENASRAARVVLEYYDVNTKIQAQNLKKSLENKLKKKSIVIKSVKYDPESNFSGGIAPQVLKIKLVID